MAEHRAAAAAGEQLLQGQQQQQQQQRWPMGPPTFCCAGDAETTAGQWGARQLGCVPPLANWLVQLGCGCRRV